MTDKESKQTIELTVDERAGLEHIASSEEPHSQRAQGLIALANGADLAEAGSTSGLTVNQMRYWLGRFNTRRLSIFPEELLPKKPLIADPASEYPLLEALDELPMLKSPDEAPMLEAPELAGELPDVISEDDVTAAAVAATETASLKRKKDKNKENKKEKKGKKNKKSKKGKKDKKNKKDKKSKKGRKGKKKKGKKDKQNKKNKKKK